MALKRCARMGEKELWTSPLQTLHPSGDICVACLFFTAFYAIFDKETMIVTVLLRSDMKLPANCFAKVLLHSVHVLERHQASIGIVRVRIWNIIIIMELQGCHNARQEKPMTSLRSEGDFSISRESAVEIDQSEDEAGTATLTKPVHMSYIFCK
mmetsp:Transcript_65557/g.102355  ORF Transcript_65557/g.102355 Transcript_65557/m.102355 type:complete len:154 (+) Transcript_65557:23-484(+)